MVVVEVAEQHDVDVLDVLLHGQVAAPAQGSETAAEQGVGEDAQPTHLEQHRGVSDPGGAHAVAP